MRRNILIAATAAAFAVGGCSGIRIYEPIDNDHYYDGAFEFATGSGEIRTEVYGNPFGEPADEFADTVRHDMRGATPGRDVVFTNSPTRPEAGPFKVIAIFNGAAPRDSVNPCLGAVPRQADRDTTRMRVGFCQGERLLSEAAGEVDGVSSSRSPQFREMVRRVMFAMVPPLDTIKFGDGDRTQF